MAQIDLPAYSYSEFRETPLTAADTWTAVDDRVDVTGLTNIKPSGKRLVALVISGATDGAAVGACNYVVRISGVGVGTHYFSINGQGGTLATTNIAGGQMAAYVFAGGLPTADELVIDAAMVGTDTGTAQVTVALYFA